MKFIINTLGCKVNTYESNVMRDLLLNAGYKEAQENEKSQRKENDLYHMYK